MTSAPLTITALPRAYRERGITPEPHIASLPGRLSAGDPAWIAPRDLQSQACERFAGAGLKIVAPHVSWCSP
jgi:hypothetical protein